MCSKYLLIAILVGLMQKSLRDLWITWRLPKPGAKSVDCSCFPFKKLSVVDHFEVLTWKIFSSTQFWIWQIIKFSSSKVNSCSLMALAYDLKWRQQTITLSCCVLNLLCGGEMELRKWRELLQWVAACTGCPTLTMRNWFAAHDQPTRCSNCPIPNCNKLFS